MRCYYIPIRMANTQKTHTTKCWPRCEVTGILIHCWWKCNGVATSGHSLAVSYKIKHNRCNKLNVQCKELISGFNFNWLPTELASAFSNDLQVLKAAAREDGDPDKSDVGGEVPTRAVSAPGALLPSAFLWPL